MRMTAIHAQPEQNGRKALPAALKDAAARPEHSRFVV
jgi:hypothetical protein